ncbi:MAG: ribonuclease [Microbacteriaceae bacterium]|nr:ribonuclease [Microbacteriaceae bacterium]
MSPLRSTASSDGELANAFAALREQLELVAAFPADVEAEAERMATAVVLPTPDQTDIPFITVDPEGSTDLDQALHLARDGDGYKAWYAIADVPAFVVPGGRIDAEARKRGQTMYAPDGRIPLHPTVLSEGAASLLPNQVRGAFVWAFDLDANANITTVTVVRAKVKSTRQAAYDEIQKEIDLGTGTESVMLLKEIGLKRIALEQARGGASLNRPDQEVSESGHSYVLTRRLALPVENWNAELSLMTGMAAATMMLDGGVGILRTMPAPDDETMARFRRQTVALGFPWAEGVEYGEFLRSLTGDDPRQAAIVHAAGSLFRGAGYAAFDGTPPNNTMQSAVGAPYTHTTAPLRRLVDRFSLVVCEALSAGTALPQWARDALPTLPAIMAHSDEIASRLDHGSIDAVEAAVLRGREGETFDAVVISVRPTGGGGVVQLSAPAVTAECVGDVVAGTAVRVTLTRADIPSHTVSFTLA